MNVDIPLNKITCIYGPSGSGKSSLAFHTLYSESKRRYINSMPESLRFFSDRPLKVDVDEISPVLPVFALPQVNPVMTSRSCIADVMGLSEKLQKLFYLLGQQFCSIHDKPYELLLPSIQINQVLIQIKPRLNDIIHILIHKRHYHRLYGINSFPMRSFDLEKKEVRQFQDGDDLYEFLRFRIGKEKSLDQKFDEFMKLDGKEEVFLFYPHSNNLVNFKYSNLKSCPVCLEEAPIQRIEYYSPYNALGACSYCSGHGSVLVYDEDKIFPNLNLSFSEDGVRVFNYKRFMIFKEKFLKEIKRFGYSEKTPIKRFNKKTWEAIRHGGKYFLGFDEIFKRLEKKRYKKDVRILLRGLQEERLCSSCDGSRLEESSRKTKIIYDDKSITLDSILKGSIEDLAIFLLDVLNSSLPVGEDKSLLRSILKSILISLRVASRIGLGRIRLLKKNKEFDHWRVSKGSNG